MKIIIDMNLSPRWVDYLIGNDIDALHWLSIGSHCAPDIQIFTYAKTHDLTILTSDLDFGYILAITNGDKPSVIQLRTDILTPDKIGSIVVSTIKQLFDDIDNGALVTINQNKIRVSLLPLN